jgi:hypothetical protein
VDLDSKELVDLFLVLHLDGRAGEFFSTVSLRETAAAWCRVTAGAGQDGANGDDAWALLVVNTIQDEEHRRELLWLLVELAPDLGVLEAVGSGPLEDFVRDHNESRIRWAVQEADRSAKFRFALSKARVSDLAAEDFIRLEHAGATP